MHVDFQHIDMTKKIQLDVAVHLQGEPEGVRNYGGILEQPARDLAVLCLPIDIPASIDVDVSEMMVGDTLHVSEIEPRGFEFVDDGSKVVAHVAAPTVEKTPAEEAEEGEVPAEGEAPAEGAEKPGEAGSADEKKGEGEG